MDSMFLHPFHGFLLEHNILNVSCGHTVTRWSSQPRGGSKAG
jgi:hypothetical protein